MTLISKDKFLNITAKFSQLKPIMVVGDIGIDKYTFGEVKRISPEAPVPILEVTQEWLKLGLAANISDNLKALDVKSTLFGVVGNDNNANILEGLLEDKDLKTWGIVRCSERPTIFKERVTTAVQQICRIDYESKTEISESIQKKLIDRTNEFGKEHSALILQDYAKGALTKKVYEHMIRSFKDQGLLVAVDPGRSTPPLFYQGAHLVKPNLVEAQSMVEHLGYQEKDLAKMAEILIEKLKIDKLVITLGAKGMALIDAKNDGKLKIIPTVAREVFDVSGAGDTAISVLTASLVAGATLEEAAWIGNCASGVVVGKKGTATVDMKELANFYHSLSDNN